MRRLATSAGALVVLLLLVPGKAQAVPLLQLDMLGGVYDPITETIVAPSGPFTIYALLTPQAGASADDIAALLAGDYYISVAIARRPELGASLGSVTVDGDTYDVTSDMIYGTPPPNAVQGGYLPSHGIFSTYYVQIPITFTMGDTAATYNTADSPGGFMLDPNGGSFFVALTGDSSLLAAPYNLHFDLYSTNTVTCPGGGDCAEIDRFAPFSHDAGTRRVPEPASAVLLLLGLGGVGALARRRA